VLGHSFGGQVALEYALRYPASLSHLILLDTQGDSWWPQHVSLTRATAGQHPGHGSDRSRQDSIARVNLAA
jgi:pimeloyl-ACP methyl ester carboxylesterase